MTLLDLLIILIAVVLWVLLAPKFSLAVFLIILLLALILERVLRGERVGRLVP